MKQPIISGKRYSEIATTTIKHTDSPEEIAEMFDQLSDPNKVKTFDNLKKSWCDNAITILEERGLPVTPIVKPSQHQTSTLDHHIIKELGYGRDSIEGLSATIIRLSDWIDRGIGDPMEWAFDLGEAATLLKVYGIESLRNSIVAKSKRRKSWGVAFAQLLIEQHPKLNFTEMWANVPDEYQPITIEGFEVYQEDGRLHASSHTLGKDESIAKSTFRTDYISRERKKQI